MVSHVNSNKSNNLNTSNSDNLIGTSYLPHSNVHDYSSFNTLVTLQKLTDTYWSVSISDETTDQNNINEEMSSRQNSVETIDHTLDDNGINLVHTEEE